jgi:hypothetical protein
MGDSLKIQIIVDSAQVTAGMSNVTASVDAATARIKAAFGSVANAPEGIQNALKVLENSARMSGETVAFAAAEINKIGQASSAAAPQIDAVDQAMNRATASANNARSAFMGLNREIGLGGNRALSTFISQSETLGPILSKAFTGIAIIGFIQLAELAGEKLSALIDDTFIFTAAQKALYGQLVADNKEIAALDEQHAKMLRDISVIGLPLVEQERLRAQYAKEDRDGLAGSVAQQEKALALARQQLTVIQQKKDADAAIRPQVTGDLSAQFPTEDFDKQIEEQQAKIDSLSSSLGKLHAQYTLAGDAVVEAQKKFDATALKDSEKAAEKSRAAMEKLARELKHVSDEQERADILTRKLADDQKEFGAHQDSKQTESDLKDMQERNDAEREFRQARIDDEKQGALTEIEIEEEKVKERFRLGKISADQEVQLLNALEAQKLQIEKTYLDQRINTILARLTSDDAKTYAEDVKEWSKLLTEKQKAEDDYLKKRQQNIDGAATNEQKTWTTLMQRINSAFDQTISGLIHGTMTFRKAFANLLDSLLSDFVSFLAKKVEKWAEEHLLELALHSTFLTNILGLDATNDAAKTAAGALAADAQIAQQAGIAGAAGFASVMASVPFPANIALAPEVMAASIATTLSNMVGGSAAGGWDVPKDALAMVHANEMILPAHISSGLKGLIGNGGGASGGVTISPTYNINAVDARGVEDVLTRSSAHLAKLMRKELRKSNAI